MEIIQQERWADASKKITYLQEWAHKGGCWWWKSVVEVGGGESGWKVDEVKERIQVDALLTK